MRQKVFLFLAVLMLLSGFLTTPSSRSYRPQDCSGTNQSTTCG